MSTPRKKVTTTTTTTEEEYYSMENDGLSTTSQSQLKNLDISTSTGDIPIDGRTSTNESTTDGFEKKFGRTWADLLFSIKEDLKSYYHIFLLLFFYFISFIIIIKFFNSCGLLQSYNWIWYPLLLGTFFSTFYLVAIFVFKKIKRKTF